MATTTQKGSLHCTQALALIALAILHPSVCILLQLGKRLQSSSLSIGTLAIVSHLGLQQQTSLLEALPSTCKCAQQENTNGKNGQHCQESESVPASPTIMSFPVRTQEPSRAPAAARDDAAARHIHTRDDSRGTHNEQVRLHVPMRATTDCRERSMSFGPRGLQPCITCVPTMYRTPALCPILIKYKFMNVHG